MTGLATAAAEVVEAVYALLGKNRAESVAAISGSIAGEKALGVGRPEEGVELALERVEPQIDGGLWSK
jgi:hypothetical protein